MKSTLLSVSCVALMVVGAACASDSGGSAGTGGASGSGGTISAGGFTSSGGSAGISSAGVSTSSGGSGGTISAGGAAGSGGAQQSGGAQSDSGGSAGTGGASGSGGSVTGGTSGGGVTGGNGGVVSGGAGGTGGAPTGGSSGQETGGGGGEVIRARQIETRGFTFDALETVSAGEPVLLLHGFPDTSLMWSGLMPVLSDAGYHCLAPDQRGYSPGARPIEVDAYLYEELVADAFAFGSELGAPYHLVAHDWGANVGWLMLEADPSPIASFTAISIPHYQVWARSVYDDPEMAGYLSLLNIWMTEGEGEAFWTPQQMRRMWTAKPVDQTEQTIAHMMEPGAMTAALNWYRASDGHQRVINDFGVWEVNVPTLLIHGSEDLGERSVTETAPLMTGSYRVVRPDGGHFIVDEQPQVVAEETLAHLRANPIQ